MGRGGQKRTLGPSSALAHLRSLGRVSILRISLVFRLLVRGLRISAPLIVLGLVSLLLFALGATHDDLTFSGQERPRLQY